MGALISRLSTATAARCLHEGRQMNMNEPTEGEHNTVGDQNLLINIWAKQSFIACNCVSFPFVFFA